MNAYIIIIGKFYSPGWNDNEFTISLCPLNVVNNTGSSLVAISYIMIVVFMISVK